MSTVAGDSPEQLVKVLITDYGNSDKIEKIEYSVWSVETFQRLDFRGKANAFAESLRGTITSFINDGYTQREIVNELDRIGVKTTRGHEFQLTTLQRVMKRLGLATLRT